MTTFQWFTIANVFVLPFWALMIILPQWDWTRRILTSYLPFVGLALLYTALFAVVLTPESAKVLANPTLADIAQLFGQEQVAAAWVHFLVMDLFVGRWIYWEGQRTGAWTSHSLVLCLLVGPIGLLSHIMTAAVFERFSSTETVMAAED
ncbi:ABA4-like family protein [Acaryochloris sp. IP29b_bin.137]|uniref:ABA4-like family protein n=1 Tax=Acaryochloris sp. IP29b_bin.137 TaxID=2969217 RepID=UPI00261017B1|nr:ABA4-like family protein [Acaryochloris sp. IP29b_bin.137]